MMTLLCRRSGVVDEIKEGGGRVEHGLRKREPSTASMVHPHQRGGDTDERAFIALSTA